MIKRFLILFTLFFLSQANTEEVNKLVIEGNKRVSDETIKVYGDIEINKDIKEAELNKIIKNLYSTNFFEDISAKIKTKTLIINVSEYPVINQLVITEKKEKVLLKKLKNLFR